jgi:hypothetical protein
MPKRTDNFDPHRHAEALRKLRLDARKRWRGRRACQATVTFDLNEWLLEIDVHSRALKRGPEHWNRWLGFAGRSLDTSDGCDEKNAKLHYEILDNQGQHGFLMRMVRRGQDPMGLPIDLDEFVFRVPKAGLHVRRNGQDITEQVGDNEAAWITPTSLVDHFRHVGRCVLLGPWGVLHVNRLYHNGRVHRVGEDWSIDTIIETLFGPDVAWTQATELSADVNWQATLALRGPGNRLTLIQRECEKAIATITTANRMDETSLGTLRATEHKSTKGTQDEVELSERDGRESNETSETDYLEENYLEEVREVGSEKVLLERSSEKTEVGV